MMDWGIFVREAARRGRVKAIREAHIIAALAEASLGVRAEADDGSVRLKGRGLKQRWLTGEGRLLSWLEEARASVRWPR